MARSRNIKPGLFKNEVLGDLDPLLSLLFIGLWTLADREGRLEDRPKRIGGELFPYRGKLDINGYLTELEQLGFIRRYSVDGLEIILIVEFLEHQSPHRTEKPSTLPAEPETRMDSGSQDLTVNAPLNNDAITDVAALIPDSLNTDSLIPDSLNTDSAATASLESAGDYLKRLVDVHLYDEREVRLRTQNMTQAKQWLEDAVTAQELDDAVAASRRALQSQGEEKDPPVTYVAKLLASARKKSSPVKTHGINTRSGFTPDRYKVSERTASRFKVVGGASS